MMKKGQIHEKKFGSIHSERAALEPLAGDKGRDR